MRRLNVKANPFTLILLLVLGFCSVCCGDVVYLTSGNDWKGTIVAEDSNTISLKIDSDGSIIRFKKDLIKKIERTAVADAKKAIAKAEKLKQEAEAALTEEKWSRAVIKYSKAIKQCCLVEKSTGEVYRRSSAISSALGKQLTAVRKELIRKGDKEFEAGNYEQAVSYYRAIIVKGDKSYTKEAGSKIVSACLPLADACFNEKEYDKSIGYYRECLVFAPRDSEISEKLADAYLMRGIGFYESGRSDKAVKDFKNCIGRVLSNERADNYLALIHADKLCEEAQEAKNRKRYSTAQDKYAEAVKIYDGLLSKEQDLSQELQKKISLVSGEEKKCLELAAIQAEEIEKEAAKGPPCKSEKPLYAKLALSEDGTKILSLVFDESIGTGKGYDIVYAGVNFGENRKFSKLTTRLVKRSGRVQCQFSPININAPYNEKGIPNSSSITLNYLKDNRGERFYVKTMIKLAGDSIQWQYSFNGSIRPSGSLEKATVWRVVRAPEKINITTRADGRKKGHLGIGLSLSPAVECKKGGVPVRAYLVVKNQEGRIVQRDNGTLDRFVFG